MRWEARTLFQNIGLGTTFSLMATVQSSIIKVELKDGDDVFVVDFENKYIPYRAQRPSKTQITLLRKNSPTLHLVPVASGQLGSNITSSLVTEDWIVERTS
ncbi:hypothetical protein FHS20_004283 [Phyllobacterium endophyticum]|nr:hypothetical protein [Phyllobacterium endophyticum]